MKHRNRRGSAMLLALGTMMVLGLLLAALLPWITAEAKFNSLERYGLEARYAAEAGLKIAVLQLPPNVGSLSTEPAWIRVDTAFGDPSIETLDVNKKKFRIDVLNPDGVTPATFPLGVGATSGGFVVHSTGTVNGISRVSRLLVTVGSGAAALYAEGNITLPKAGQPFTVDGVIATPGVFCDGKKCGTEASPNVVCTSVTPCLSPGASPITIPPFPTYDSTTMTLVTNMPTGSLPGGTTYYINGDWDGGNSVNITTTGVVKIYVNGDVTLKNTTAIQALGPSAAILIQTTGNATVWNTSNPATNQFVGVGLIANGNIDIKNNSFFNGFMIAGDNLDLPAVPNSMEVANNGSITYNPNVMTNLGIPGLAGLPTWDMSASLWSK